MLAHVVSYQLLGLGDVMVLSPSQRKSQWIAEAIDTHMDFRAKSASTPTKGL
jgi:hypothetical protein